MTNSETTVYPLKQYFDTLSEKGVRFCVLRSYESLPEVIEANDVDLLIGRNDVSRAILLLKEAFKQCGSEYYFLTREKNIHKFQFFFQDENLFFNDSIKIDLIVNFESKGRVFLTSDEILDNIRPYKTFYIPSEVHEVFMYALKRVAQNGYIKSKHLEKAQDALGRNKLQVEKLLQDFFYSDTVQFLLESFEGKRKEELWHNAGSFRLETYCKTIIRNPFIFTTNFLLYFWFVAISALRPPNYSMAFLGPDGAGKSTLVDHTTKNLMRVMKISRKDVKVFHNRPQVLPTISQVIRKLKGLDKQKGVPNGQKPVKSKATSWQKCESPYDCSTPFLVSLFKVTCFWFDYALGFVLKVMPEFRKQRIVMLDRYFHDFVVFPARYKINLRPRITKIFLRFVPKPKATFVINVPVDVIRQRKKELTREMIGALTEGYLELAAQFGNTYVLDGIKSPKNLSKQTVTSFIKSAAYKINDT